MITKILKWFGIFTPPDAGYKSRQEKDKQRRERNKAT